MNEQEIVEQFIKWMLANKWYICIWDKNFSWYMRDRILPEELAKLFIQEWHTVRIPTKDDV